MFADVTQSCGADQGIAKRMQQHVGIGMPGESALKRNGHAADDQRPPLNQRMHVKALSDTHFISLQIVKSGRGSVRPAPGLRDR